jgi:phage terminase large subunit
MKFDLSNLQQVTNDIFYPLYGNRDRYLVLWGGGDSGKSRFAAKKLAVRTVKAASEGRKHKWLVVRKTQPAVEKSAFDLMWSTCDEFGLKPPLASKTKKPMTITDKWGNHFIFSGMDDHEKIKSIEGITGIWCEEATELNFEDFWQLDNRLRGQTPYYKQIILSFNPVSIESWINDEFFKCIDDKVNVDEVTPDNWPNHMRRIRIRDIDGDTPDRFATLHHSVYKDNKFMDPVDASVLEGYKYKDDNFYKVYCLGQWGVLKGLVYENYEETDEWPEDRFDCHGYGLDFGYSNSPTACAELGFIRNEVYIRELLYEKGLTNDEINARLKPYITTQSYTVADCAEPKSITELQQCGMLVVPCTKGPDSIVHGIQRVQQFNLHIHSSSINLLRELRAYKWAEDKEGKLLNKPVDAFNHLLDAVRYSLVNLKGMTQASVTFEIEDPKAERKAEMNKPEYVMANDEEVWTQWDD